MKKYSQFWIVLGIMVLLLQTTTSISNATMVMSLDDLSTIGVDAIIVDNAGVGTSTALGVSNYADINPLIGTVGFDGSVGTFTSNVMVGSITYNIGDQHTVGQDNWLLRFEGTHIGKGELIAELTATDLVLDHPSPISTRKWALENGYTYKSISNNPYANKHISHVAEIGYIGLGNEEFEKDIASQLSKVEAILQNELSVWDFDNPLWNSHNFSDQLEPGSPFSMTSWVLLSNLPKKADVTQYNQYTKISAVPEPTTMLLLGAGLIGLAGFGRKKFKK